MIIKFDTSALQRTTRSEYGVRFLLGGLITAVTGIIATRFGPSVAGLFLAFPAILPAALTLVEKHERQKKQRRGLHGDKRARYAAALDAAGAAMGSVGLLAFAVAVWRLVPRGTPLLGLGIATIAWMVVSFSVWLLHR